LFIETTGPTVNPLDRVPTGGTTELAILIEIELTTLKPPNATDPTEEAVPTVVDICPAVVVVYRTTPLTVLAAMPFAPRPDVVAGTKLPFVKAQNIAPAGMTVTDCFTISPVDAMAISTPVADVPAFAVVIELARNGAGEVPAVITTKSDNPIDVLACTKINSDPSDPKARVPVMNGGAGYSGVTDAPAVAKLV